MHKRKKKKGWGKDKGCISLSMLKYYRGCSQSSEATCLEENMQIFKMIKFATAFTAYDVMIEVPRDHII